MHGGYNSNVRGADFFVEKQNGEHIGEFTTDEVGMIYVPNQITETQGLEGYHWDEAPQTCLAEMNYFQ